MKTYSDCQEVRDEFSALLDGELRPDEQEGVETHLSQCAQCLRELDGLKNVDTLYRRLPFVNAPEGFEEGIRDALKPTHVFRLRKRPFRKVLYGSLAAAALLLVVAGLTTPWLPDSRQRFNMAQNEEAESPVIGGALEAQRAERPQDTPESGFAAQEPAKAAKDNRLEADRADALYSLNKVKSLGYVEDDESRARRRVAATSPAPPASQPPAPGPAVAPKTRAKSAVSAVSVALQDSAKPDALFEEEPPRAMPMPARSAGRASSEKGELVTLGIESASQAARGGMASGRDLGGARSDAGVNDMNFDTVLSEDLDELRAREVSQAFTAPEEPEEKKVSDYRKNEEVFFQRTADDQPAPVSAKSQTAGDYEGNERAADIKRSPAGAPEETTGKRSTVASVSVRRSFDKRDGIWYQTGYSGQRLTELSRDSKPLRALIAQHREINDYLNWKERVIFRIDRKWYALKAQEP